MDLSLSESGYCAYCGDEATLQQNGRLACINCRSLVSNNVVPRSVEHAHWYCFTCGYCGKRTSMGPFDGLPPFCSRTPCISAWAAEDEGRTT